MLKLPHGGEVLGAAPANPILAPVLSHDRGLRMSRQRDLLDLQAIQRIPGLVGYWKSDPQYLFEDSAGTTPASVGGVVGGAIDVSRTVTIGSELISNGTFTTDMTSWNNLGGTTSVVVDGVARITNTIANRGIYSAPADRTEGIYEITGRIRLVSGTGPVSLRAINSSYVLIGSGETTTLNTFATVSFRVNTVANFLVACTSTGATDVFELDDVTCKRLSGNYAVQATTANKPILRKTPTTGVYWVDSNTATSALNVALGNLGSSCTVAQSGADGVTFTEGVTISSTYNIAPTFSFNSDVAIFNRALTATEKALITRYMQRAVPQLGSNLIGNSDFATDTWWTKGPSTTIADGVDHTVSSSNTTGLTRSALQTVGVLYFCKYDISNWVSGSPYVLQNGVASSSTGNGTKRVTFIADRTLFTIAHQTNSTYDLDNLYMYQIL